MPHIIPKWLEAGARALLDWRADGRAVSNSTTKTLSDVYETWLERRRRRGLRNTYSERLQLTKYVLPVIGDMPLGAIRVRHIRDFVDGLRMTTLAPRTIRGIYATVRKLFADLVVDEMLPSTPCVLTKDQLPKRQDKDPEWRERAVFTRAEAEILVSDVDVIPPDRRVLNAIKFLAGVRIGEAVGLRWRDLDEATEPLKRLLIARSYDQGTKTGVPRPVPVHPLLATILGEWKRTGFVRLTGRIATPDDLIVPSRTGGIRCRRRHRKAFIRDLCKLGLRPRRVHDTRRTFITLARVDGARRDVLEHVTHAPAQTMVDLYTTLPWPTLCEAVMVLNLKRITRAEVRRRLAAIRDAALPLR